MTKKLEKTIHTIYAITDHNGNIRYIGRTTNFKARARLHLSASYRAYSIVRGILADLYQWMDTHPHSIITIAQYTDMDAAISAEASAIHDAINDGCDLFNVHFTGKKNKTMRATQSSYHDRKQILVDLLRTDPRAPYLTISALSEIANINYAATSQIYTDTIGMTHRDFVARFL